MPKGELFFRKAGNNSWIDVYDRYGISFTDASLSMLMTPVPNKDEIENKSRLQHGKRIVRKSQYVRKDERTVTLEMHLQAPTRESFWSRYDEFCDDFLAYGFFDIAHRDIRGKVFRMTYKNCEQFSEFMQCLAKFTLTLNEPDPSNRATDDSWSEEGGLWYRIDSTANSAEHGATLETKLSFLRGYGTIVSEPYPCHWIAYTRSGGTYTVCAEQRNIKVTTVTLELTSVSGDAIVFYMCDDLSDINARVLYNTPPAGYLAKLEIPVTQ